MIAFAKDLQEDEYILPQNIVEIDDIIEWCKGNLNGKEKTINR